MMGVLDTKCLMCFVVLSSGAECLNMSTQFMEIVCVFSLYDMPRLCNVFQNLETSTIVY